MRRPQLYKNLENEKDNLAVLNEFEKIFSDFSKE